MFSDSCPFCCHWWRPQSPAKLSNCLQQEQPSLASCLSVCVYIYITYLYISHIYIYHTSLYISVSAFLHHPTQCGTAVRPLAQSVSPGSVALCHLCMTQAGVPCLSHPSHVGRWQIRLPLPP